MKFVKLEILFTVGILAVLLAVGCAQPTVSFLGEADMAGKEAGLDESFTVTFTINGDDEARSVAGPDANRIYVFGADGIRNYAQLIVLDQSSTTTPKTVAAFAEQRKVTADNENFELSIGNLAPSKTYSFLLLMGNWERTDNGVGNYAYNETKKPTLLAAGITTQELAQPGETTVSITMWPIVVNTRFKQVTQTTTEIVEPKVDAGVPRPAYLTPGEWKVEWAIQRSIAGTNGFEKALIPAQVKAGTGGSAELVVKSKEIYFPGDSKIQETGAISNILIDDIPSGETQNGDSDSVYFNLEYVPFNLTDLSYWEGKTSSFLDPTKDTPAWIIRNGLNDLAQDGNTNFNSSIGYTGASKNGNGAVRYVVGLDPTLPQDLTLVVENGSFVGSPGSTTPKIKFDTRGYTGDADLWYAVAAEGLLEPDRVDYIWLGKLSAATGHVKTISVPSGHLTAGYDVYVRIAQNGKVSPYMGLRARPNGPGGPLIEVPWGPAPVSDLDLTGSINAPLAGALASSATYSFIDRSGQYTGTIEGWYDLLDGESAISGEFAYGHAYKARVHLIRSGSYIFTGVGPFTHDGAFVYEVEDSRSPTGISLDIGFPNISLGVSRVTKTDLTLYIYPPTEDPDVVTTEIDTDQYTGTVAWNPPPLFIEGTTYDATINLSPKTGWTFAGLTTPFIHAKSEGVLSTDDNPDGSVTIKIRFIGRATGPELAELLNLFAAGLPPPGGYDGYRENIPHYIVDFGNSYYTGDAEAWFSHNGLSLWFQDKHGFWQHPDISDPPYVVNISIMTKPGYSFAGLKESDFSYITGDTVYDEGIKIVIRNFYYNPYSEVINMSVYFPDFYGGP
jgi:hypothetical protein